MIMTLIDLALILALLATAVMMIRLRNLFAMVMLAGVFSLLSASLFVALDAVDVAFTEAAVGGGISTVLMLGALALTARHEAPIRRNQLVPLGVTIATGAALLYGTADLPLFGDPAAPVHTHVAPYYLATAPKEIGIDNFVTAILASYRGFDTLGETMVVFTAGVAVLFLLRSARRSRGEVSGPRDDAPDARSGKV
ncbi:MAG: DUF4040 domain-containing protein [Parvibaculaceae bacterium]|nr:DUF4040 domain-containing protein [Parvibaculaceae bacterium]